MKKFLLVVLLALGSCGPKEVPIADVIDGALEGARAQYKLMAEKYGPMEGRLPRSWANNEDVSSDSGWWCSGFFPGTLWYLYAESGDEAMLGYAREFSDRVEREKYTTSNHDVGFMLMSSFGNALRFDPDASRHERYKEILSTGARSLATRFKPNIGLIRSWDHNRDKWQYPVIIDNMMNLELLLTVAGGMSGYGGESVSDYEDAKRLSAIAYSHADSTLVNHFRDDFGSYHVVSYDTLTGVVEKKQTHQGYADDSTWARGEAWALYGYTVMYRLTREQRYLTQAQAIARFMIHHPNMPADYIPYWDYNAPDIKMLPVIAGQSTAEGDVLRDASAAAIMASALIELAGFSEGELAAEYMKVAERQIRTLASEAYTAAIGENGDFILMHCVGGLPFGSEVDVPLTYADYYFVEALSRLKHTL